MQFLAIGNPVAGGGRARSLIEELTRLLEAEGHRVDGFLTSGAGDARERARALGADYRAIIVAGGDGTLNEVLNGLEDTSSIPLAFVPAGTGNVIAYELGLTRRPDEVVRAIQRGTVRRLDVGLAGDRRFLMLASAGFDALVTHEVTKSRTGTFWLGGYVVPILRSLKRYRQPELSVVVDGGEPVAGALAIVSKTPYYGGIFTIADDARCDSGHFSVCVFRRASALALCRYGIAAFRKTLKKVSGIVRLNGCRVEITSKEPTPVQVDGDYFGTTPVVLDIMPAALPMIVSTPGGHRPAEAR